MVYNRYMADLSSSSAIRVSQCSCNSVKLQKTAKYFRTNSKGRISGNSVIFWGTVMMIGPGWGLGLELDEDEFWSSLASSWRFLSHIVFYHQSKALMISPRSPSLSSMKMISVTTMMMMIVKSMSNEHSGSYYDKYAVNDDDEGGDYDTDNIWSGLPCKATSTQILGGRLGYIRRWSSLKIIDNCKCSLDNDNNDNGIGWTVNTDWWHSASHWRLSPRSTSVHWGGRGSASSLSTGQTVWVAKPHQINLN